MLSNRVATSNRSCRVVPFDLRIMFGRGVDVSADPRDRAFAGIEAGDTKVSDLYYFFVAGEQQILRFDVAMNHTALVCVSQAGTDLLQVENAR